VDSRLETEEWYHDFAILGLKTRQRPGIYASNQRCKQEHLFKFISDAIRLCKKKAEGIDLFCADGFYSNYAIQGGADRMYGVDLDKDELDHARLITRLLGNAEKIVFEQRDVHDLQGSYDFGICAGGLYHLSDPEVLLRKLTTQIQMALVIQTVYSLARSERDYFETPAPGWSWGCRFSLSYMSDMIARAGWSVIQFATNELAGNERPEDRGSAYLLCVPSVQRDRS
jgi:predicted RNA methylase